MPVTRGVAIAILGLTVLAAVLWMTVETSIQEDPRAVLLFGLVGAGNAAGVWWLARARVSRRDRAALWLILAGAGFAAAVVGLPQWMDLLSPHEEGFFSGLGELLFAGAIGQLLIAGVVAASLPGWGLWVVPRLRARRVVSDRPPPI